MYDCRGSEEAEAALWILLDEMQGFSSVADRVGDKLPVKGCQLTAVAYGEGEKVAVRHLRGIEKARRMDVAAIEQADGVRPELVSWMSKKDFHQFGNGGWCSGRIWIAGMSNDSQHSVFGKGAGSPSLCTGAFKPFMCLVMLNMQRIDEGNEYVHVQQETCHCKSSRS